MNETTRATHRTIPPNIIYTIKPIRDSRNSSGNNRLIKSDEQDGEREGNYNNDKLQTCRINDVSWWWCINRLC